MTEDCEAPRRHRVRPGDRVGGAMSGLIQADLEARTHGIQAAAHLLTSLESQGRFVLPEFLDRLSRAGLAPPSDLDLVVRAVPLALWLRGPDTRIALAAVRQALTASEDPFPVLGAALLCLWLRALHEKAPPEHALSDALKRLEEASRQVGIDDSTVQILHDALESEATASMHPVSLALFKVSSTLARCDSFEELSAELKREGAGVHTLAIAGAAGGMLFGIDEVVPRTESTPDPESKTLLDALIQRGNKLYRLHRWPPETSQSHPLPVATITLSGEAKLGVCKCPGLNNPTPANAIDRDFEADLQRIVEWGARHMVCLLPADTLLDMRLERYADSLESMSIRPWLLPWLGDADEAWFEQEWDRVRIELAQVLRAGESVLIHGLDIEAPATELAVQLLGDVLPEAGLSAAKQQVDEAVESALEEFSRHDLDA